MGFDIAGSEMSDFEVLAQDGPYLIAGQRAIWVNVVANFQIPEGAVAHLTFNVPVEMGHDPKWSEIEARALRYAQELLANKDLAEFLSKQLGAKHSG